MGGYYGVTSDMMTDLMLKIKDENVVTKKQLTDEEEYYRSLSKPINICIVNASSPVCYNLLPSIASGEIFGSDVEIAIKLLDDESASSMLQGTAMEIVDFAYPLLRKIDVVTDMNVAFDNASVVIILGKDADSTKDREVIVAESAELYQQYAVALDANALGDVKV